jgi:hypothetical protein
MDTRLRAMRGNEDGGETREHVRSALAVFEGREMQNFWLSKMSNVLYRLSCFSVHSYFEFSLEKVVLHHEAVADCVFLEFNGVEYHRLADT